MEDYHLQEKYRVKLENYFGPMDLLLHLIKINELDIQNIPIAVLTDQYLKYIEIMRSLNINLAAEFLVMAATLMHIKAKSLLPDLLDEEDEEEDDDPRMEFIKKLIEYKFFKEMAEKLRVVIAEHNTRFPVGGVSYSKLIASDTSNDELPKEEPEILIELSLWELCAAFARIAKETGLESQISILYDDIPVETIMLKVREIFLTRSSLRFSELVGDMSNRPAVVSGLLASLELAKQREVELEQCQDFGDIVITDITKQTASADVSMDVSTDTHE